MVWNKIINWQHIFFLLTDTIFFFLIYIFFLQPLFYYLDQKSPLILHANCMSFGMIVTRFVWMAQIFASSRSPFRNASPTSCNASTTELCNFSPSLCFCTISLTSLWKGTLQMSKSAPFWYFWISFRACIPHWIFRCFSIFSSLMIFNCLSLLSFILSALIWFSSLSFLISATLLSPASLTLSLFAFSFDTFTILAISNNGRWIQFSPYVFCKFCYYFF